MNPFMIVSATEIAYIPFWILKLKSRRPRNMSAPDDASESVLPSRCPLRKSNAAAKMVKARSISGSGKECSKAK